MHHDFAGCAAPPRQTGRTQRSLLPVAAAAALLERVQEVATEAQKPVTISISTHFQVREYLCPLE